ncbi:MAG: carboxymuconolactone decarboxylase family protein [Methylovirgula sp.]|uniref:carboxymuconolactone decarboxylase family protein n=1 Tax=Methylovirgula sp. TaxID=1978224 RepID=UPI003076578B
MKDDEALGGRLPLIDVAQLDPNQRQLLDYLEASKFPWAEKSGFRSRLSDGRLIGPFNVFLFSPQMARAFNAWVDAESACTSLAEDVRQIVILTIGVVWRADYEIYAHLAVARSAGVDEATLSAIQEKKDPEAAPDAIRIAWQFTHQLVETHGVENNLYRQATAMFGEHGLVDMLNLIGLYLSTSALLNAFAVPAPQS